MGSDVPLWCFGLGTGLLFLALAGTISGDAWARYGLVVRRSENPAGYWFLVATYYAAGIGLLGYFFYKLVS